MQKPFKFRFDYCKNSTRVPFNTTLDKESIFSRVVTYSVCLSVLTCAVLAATCTPANITTANSKYAKE